MNTSIGTLYERAEARFLQGNYPEAEALYVQVIAAGQDAGAAATLAVLSSMQRIAQLAVLAGEWDRAIDRLDFAYQGFVQAGNRYMADYVRTSIASVENARGMARAAKQLLGTLSGRPSSPWDGTAAHLRVWETEWAWPGVSQADRAIFFSRYYLEAGAVEAFTGQFARAAALLRRGLYYCTQDQIAAEAAIPVSLSLASVHLQQGDLRTAGQFLAMVPAELDEQKDPGFAVHRLELKARLDLLTGDLGPAKAALERALALCRRTGAHAAWMVAALNLAQVLVFLNQAANARELCRQVLENAQARGDTAAQVRAAHILSLCDERTTSLVSSVSLAPSVTEMWLGRKEAKPTKSAEPSTPPVMPFDIDESPDFLTLLEERTLGLYWYLARGELGAARSFLDNELDGVFAQSQAPTDSLLIRARLHALDCMLAYYEGRYAETLEGLRALCPVLRELGLKPDLWQALRILEWTLIRLGRASEADAVAAESAKVLAAVTQSLTGADAALFLLNKWTTAEMYMAAEIEALTKLKRKLAAPGWRALVLRPWYWVAIAWRLAALLDYGDQYKAAALASRPGQEPDLPAANQRRSLLRLWRHSRSRATVAYIVLPDMTLIARAGWMALDFGVSAISRIELREWVRQWHEAVRDEEAGKATLAMRQLRVPLQVDMLIATLPRRVAAVDFVADDVLHGLPFAALRYGGTDEAAAESGQYLGVTHAITVRLRWSPQARGGALQPGGNGMVVGVPYGADGWNPLPNAAAEAESVAERLRSCSLPVVSARERRGILERLPQARYFHIACHGTFEPDRPEHSGLVIITESREVELLTVRDIAGLDLRGLEQAVLSGCWAADNFIYPGRWIVSLPSAFCHAGAKAVVAALWPTDDKAAAQFFASIYQGTGGIALEELLRRARQKCIADEATSDPFFWAGVQVYRDG